ncbi:poly-beta-hydroxybutyrate polymerase [Novosphingobium sp. PC22D]|uniref:PHA/PHB synthase family protein n=1 Tax=Novosphingobium sp. PC22D TaxID=1962403 RepID=UPI000BF23A51|nr:alpha/beta fold hydrolase [Novosphingobium sp. PC22D]PEQ14028.1 poly-beta-hydroxybutyrate polymerase [Novosphingobium sp. PC22D]
MTRAAEADRSPQDFDPLDGLAATMDHAATAAVAQMTSALSPATLIQAVTDWAVHLAISPGKQLQLGAKAVRKSMRFADYVSRASSDSDAEPAIEPLANDRRFRDPAWSEPPYSFISQAFLLHQQWWHAATNGIGGVTKHHQDVLSFATRQMLDVVAPTNFLATNPVLQRRIRETGGKCLIDGAANLLEDARRQLRGEPPCGAENFRAGETIATAPGKVVYRNHLIELIQYEPTTDTVHPEPVLIVPAWIMKYYILDLSPHNSLVRWLTGQGFTVFMISWRNPTAKDRDLAMADYREMGPMAAIDVVSRISGGARIHAAGYCLGGTLMAIAAAAMARDGDERLASLTLFAAQTEFSEPGELGLFIDEAQLHLLESLMWSEGYLDGSRMGGAFQILRSNDLIWSHVLGTYLMGEREPMSDLMAWNADSTRMPFAMHSEYLRSLFLNDDLAEGRFRVDGRAVSLSGIRVPLFVVGTERDHVAPWRSVHKIHGLVPAQIRFVLASGGHNVGIVAEPGSNRAKYRTLLREEEGPALSADEWETRAERRSGSWWPEWGKWLHERSAEPAPPPRIGDPASAYDCLADAPGTYVKER